MIVVESALTEDEIEFQSEPERGVYLLDVPVRLQDGSEETLRFAKDAIGELLAFLSAAKTQFPQAFGIQ